MSWVKSLVFITFCLLNHHNIHSNPINVQETGNYALPRVWLTVSPIVDIFNATKGSNPNAKNSSVVRALELHWQVGTNGPSEGDVLELYRFGQENPIRSYPIKAGIQNYIKTDIEFPYQTDSELETKIAQTTLKPYNTKRGKISGQCLHYYLVYVSSHKIEAINCIQLNPRWMEHDFNILKNKTLEEIMIPGSHDATSYDSYNMSFYETDVLDGRFHYTQDENLYAQLAYGIRYFDMRVAVYNDTPGTETFWMVHGLLRNRITMKQAFEQIRRFLDHTTHELVIVDFHRFENAFDGESDTNMIKNRLKNFYKILLEELEKYLIPYSANKHATIGDMIHSGKRVILGYYYKNKNLFDTDLLWPNVEQLWAETDEIHQLESYMSKHICKRNHAESRTGTGIHLQSMQAELTPSVNGILTIKYHGLRELAALVNVNFDHWFRELYWKCANIVSPDYFLGSDVVQIAVDVNRRRFGNQTVYANSVLVH